MVKAVRCGVRPPDRDAPVVDREWLAMAIINGVVQPAQVRDLMPVPEARHTKAATGSLADRLALSIDAKGHVEAVPVGLQPDRRSSSARRPQRGIEGVAWLRGFCLPNDLAGRVDVVCVALVCDAVVDGTGGAGGGQDGKSKWPRRRSGPVRTFCKRENDDDPDD